MTWICSCLTLSFYKGFRIKLFSSPELKAQVSFSDQNLSVVPRRHCRRKLFTFSSPKPLDLFQPNWHKESIIGCRGFMFVQMKGPALFQGEINNEMTKFQNILPKKHRAYFDQTRYKASLGDEDSSFFKWESPTFFKGR